MTLYKKYDTFPSLTGQTVTVIGWIRKYRTAGKITFMQIESGLDDALQIVAKKDLVPKECTIEAYCQVTGAIQALPAGKYSGLPVEMLVASITVLSPCEASYQNECPPGAGAETRLFKRHLYLRDPTFALTTRLRAQLIQAIRAHFEQTDCLEIIPPCFTGVETEGGATLFKVPYPGKSSDKPVTAYLTQSSQFALEMALPGVGDCYCIYPSFRAENSHTRRHLTEFLHAECEWSGILTFQDHIDHVAALLQGIMHNFIRIAEKTLKQLSLYERVQKLCEMTRTDQIVILEHKDAIAECTKRGIFKVPETSEPFGERDDIPEAQERQLIDAIGKIVFLCKFPKEFKSFYMGLDPADHSRVLGLDAEVPGVGEILGSGGRECDYDRLYQRLIESGLDPKDYQELLDLRRYGSGKTSGMGLGVDRMLTWIMDTHSIRDVVTFPRFPGYLRP